ncbi:MAG: hypothetical protein AAB647_03585 [Patescibacteria group bacterium]
MPKLFFLTLAISLVFGGSDTLAAETSQAGLSLQISPPVAQLKVAPGSSATYQLKVKNLGNLTERLMVTPLKFVPSGDEGKADFLDFAPGDPVRSWLRLDSPTLTLQPNEQKVIPIGINLPSTARDGYYLAFQIGRAKEEGAPAQTGAAVNTNVVSLLLVDASTSATKRSLSITEFTASQGIFEFLPAKFNIRLKNDGNIHLAPIGNIFIDNHKDDKDIAAINVNEAGSNVLPNSERVLSVEWNEGFPVWEDKIADGKVVQDKKGRSVRSLKWDLTQVPKFRIGKYTATLAMAYNNGDYDVPLKADVTFWVIPWRILLGAALVGFVFLRGFRGFLRPLRGRRRARRRR